MRSGPVITVTLAPDLVQRVIETLEPIRTGAASTRASQLARLLLALDIMATAHAAASRREIAVAGTPTLVTDAIELMASDLAFPWTLDELSRRIFVGRFHLARVFARAVGEPPMHYLARLRAERAAAMLVSTDLPVAVVGTKVGWPDPAYFSRRFRASFGVSPRMYRTQHGAGSTAPPRLVNGVQELRKGGQVAS